jgi:hypothetical protein
VRGGIRQLGNLKYIRPTIVKVVEESDAQVVHLEAVAHDEAAINT